VHLVTHPDIIEDFMTIPHWAQDMVLVSGAEHGTGQHLHALRPESRDAGLAP